MTRALALLTILFFTGCGGRESTPAPQPTATAVPTQAPDASLFPIAVITRHLASGAVRCMGGFFENDIVVTAGHCLQNISQKACSDGSLSVAFASDLRGVPSAAALTPSSCTAFTAPSDAGEPDLGALFIARSAPRPKAFLSVATQAAAAGNSLFAWGPPSQGTFSVAFGQVTGLAEFLSHNAATEEGFSGSPLFIIPASLPDSATQSEIAQESVPGGVAGIHLGWVGGVPGAMPAMRLKEWMAALSRP